MTSTPPAPPYNPYGSDDGSEPVTTSQGACDDVTPGKSTKRVREHRKWRRRGIIVLRLVRLEQREIEHLEANGYIDGTQRADRKAITEADAVKKKPRRNGRGRPAIYRGSDNNPALIR